MMMPKHLKARYELLKAQWDLVKDEQLTNDLVVDYDIIFSFYKDVEQLASYLTLNFVLYGDLITNDEIDLSNIKKQYFLRLMEQLNK